MRVGVVLPSYNASRFIASAIASIRAQSLQPVAIVVADDCSKDDSVAVAEACGATVVRLAQNAGPGSARNAGVAALPEVDLVAFLDADDQWTPDHLALLIPCFEDPDTGAAYSRERVLGEKDLGNRMAPPGPATDLLYTLLERNVVSQSGVVLRREVFEAAGGYREGSRFAEDYDLWLRVAALTKFRCIPVITSLWRVHSGNASQNRAKLVRGAIEARENGITFARAHGRVLSDELLARSLEAMIRQELMTAAYNADLSVVRALSEAFPPDSTAAQLVQSWRKRNMPRWPWHLFKSRLRRVVKG